MPAAHGVAPPELIRQDFRILDARETLRTTWANEQLLLLQSVQGHAHEGHGIFRGHRFPNTTLDDVIRALRLEPRSIAAERQALIDAIRRYVERVLGGDPPLALQDEDGAPLLGVSTLLFCAVEPADVLRGLYVGGLRDDADVRADVQRERGIRIGRGRCFFVDFPRMAELGMNADDLARGEWEDQIAEFRHNGLIVDSAQAHRTGVAWQYVRLQRGPGASDDAAIVAGGLLWGLGAAVGVLLADAIDTLEKYVPEYSDQDAELARRIENQFGELRLGRQDVKTLTYLAAVPEGQERDVPDSSFRHLLSVDRHSDICALEAHLLAVRGASVPNIGLGHERTPSARFYQYVRERLSAL